MIGPIVLRLEKVPVGGAISMGRHTISWWSRRQARVALSSCEAELNAMIKGASEAILLASISELFCESAQIVLKTDSSAAKGVVMRSGSGKLKHLSVKQLWLQDYTASDEIVVEKLPRELNPSDALTHEWSSKDWKFFTVLGFSDVS